MTTACLRWSKDSGVGGIAVGRHTTGTLSLERADIRSITAGCIRIDAIGKIKRPRAAALIRRQAKGVALINCRAGALKRVRQRRSAIVGERIELRTLTSDVCSRIKCLVDDGARSALDQVVAFRVHQTLDVRTNGRGVAPTMMLLRVIIPAPEFRMPPPLPVPALFAVMVLLLIVNGLLPSLQDATAEAASAANAASAGRARLVATDR